MDKYTVREVAELILEISGSESLLAYEPLPTDDPKQRCPDITRAREVLGWEPHISARDDLEVTLRWFAGRMQEFSEKEREPERCASY